MKQYSVHEDKHVPVIRMLLIPFNAQYVPPYSQNSYHLTQSVISLELIQCCVEFWEWTGVRVRIQPPYDLSSRRYIGRKGEGEKWREEGKKSLAGINQNIVHLYVSSGSCIYRFRRSAEHLQLELGYGCGSI